MNKIMLALLMILIAGPVHAMNDDSDTETVPHDIELGTFQSHHSSDRSQTAYDDNVLRYRGGPINRAVTPTDDSEIYYDSLNEDNVDQDFIRPDDLGRRASLEFSYDHANNPILQLIGQMIENNRLTTMEAHKLRLAHERVVHELRKSNDDRARIEIKLQAVATQQIEIGKAIQGSVHDMAKDHNHLTKRANQIVCAQAYVQPCVTGAGLLALFIMLGGNGEDTSNAISSNANTISNALYQIKPACYCMCPACPNLELPTPALTSTTGYNNSTLNNSTNYFNTTYNPALSMNSTEFMAMVTDMTSND